MTKSKSAVTLIAVAALALVCTYPLNARAAAEGSFHRTLQVTGPVDMDIATGSGDIDVHTGSGNTIEITGRIRASGWAGDPQDKVRKLEANPPIQQSGNNISIGHISDESLKHNVSITYRVVVPEGTQLTAHTGSGDQKIEGIRGPLEAHSGSGNLRATSIGSDVKMNTGSGDISLDRVKGSVRSETGSGNIRANGIAGSFDGRSGSGEITLEQTAPGEVRAEAGSGNIELRGVHGLLNAKTGSGDVQVDGVPTGEWKLRAGSGNITARVPSDASFDVDAETNSGTISVNHPVTVQGKIGRRAVHGKVRGGGSTLEARTGSGDIEIN